MINTEKNPDTNPKMRLNDNLIPPPRPTIIMIYYFYTTAMSPEKTRTQLDLSLCRTLFHTSLTPLVCTYDKKYGLSY
jgi:hypothetical protein